MLSKLSICLLKSSDCSVVSLEDHLAGDRYQTQSLDYQPATIDSLKAQKEKIDCLIAWQGNQSSLFFEQLATAGILLPVVFVESDDTKSTQRYHSAERYLDPTSLDALALNVDQAIACFLHLAPSCAISDAPTGLSAGSLDKTEQPFLLLQQRRLAEKLRERLGYLGVYYKRKSDFFYRNLSEKEKEEFQLQFSADYRDLILSYFHGDPSTNQVIDRLVSQAFFADISASFILETHMQLIEEFSQQLKLEGRSEEILLDYRLTLIDMISHLCELYRRSIPREDLPFELLFRID